MANSIHSSPKWLLRASLKSYVESASDKEKAEQLLTRNELQLLTPLKVSDFIIKITEGASEVNRTKNGEMGEFVYSNKKIGRPVKSNTNPINDNVPQSSPENNGSDSVERPTIFCPLFNKKEDVNSLQNRSADNQLRLVENTSSIKNIFEKLQEVNQAKRLNDPLFSTPCSTPTGFM